MSFYTSLSGLQAAQTDMSTISHNLANVSTNGFKKSRTEFADVIASSVSLSPTNMIGSGTVIKAIRQQFGQGGLQQSASSLDLAIAGDGFFAVRHSLDNAGVNFTRNGSFLVNSERYVTDAQGSYLQVYPVDGSGAVVASGLGSTVNLRLPQTSGVAEATRNVSLNLNLSANSAIPSAATRFTDANPYAFDRFDPGTYNQSTQTTIYDASGNAVTLTNYFVRETAGNNSTWSVYSFVGDQQLTVDAANPAPITMTFDQTGALTAPIGATRFAPFTPSGSNGEQQIALDFGTGTTQLGAPFSINQRSQDGRAVGQLQGVTVDKDGTVRASFSNGDNQALGRVALANFANPSGLRQLGTSSWTATGLSGEPLLGEPGNNGFGSLM